MKTFTKFTEDELNEQLNDAIMTILLIRESDSNELYEAFDQDCDIINEGLMDVLNMDIKTIASNLNKVLSKGAGKVGIKRTNKGLISYIMSAGKGVGKMILAGIKGDKETVKQLIKSVKKEDIIDFLLKMDTLTLHMFGGPIHTIDAITGWNIGANLKRIVSGKTGAIAKIKNAMSSIRDSVGDLMDKTRATVFNKNMDKLETEIV